MTRRRYLHAAGALGAVAIAGCTSDSETQDLPETDDRTPASNATPTEAAEFERVVTETAREVDVTGAWPTAGYDTRRTGYSPEAGDTGEPTEAWSVDVRGHVKSTASLVVDEGVYVAFNDHDYVYALDSGTGEPRWRRESRSRRLTAGADSLFAGGTAAVDATTGEERWREDVGGRRHLPAVVDDVVFVGGDDVTALDAETGEERWSHGTGAGVQSPLAVTEDTVYGVVGKSTLTAVSRSERSRQWTFETTEDLDERRGDWISTPVVDDGLVYLKRNDGTLFALDATSGDVEWSESFDDLSQFGHPVVTGDALLFFADGDYVALDRETRETLWRRELDWPVSAAPVAAGTTLYLGDLSSTLAAVDVTTGETRWSKELSVAPVHVSPVGEHFFVGGKEGEVVCLS